jgi:hypothetical protein
MPGTLLNSGKLYILNSIKTQIDATNLYMGLMTTSYNPANTSQIGSGITEFDPSPNGSGYSSRKLVSSWAVYSGVDPYLSGEYIEFTISGVWENVNGYFIAESNVTGVADILWVEPFPLEKQGIKTSSESIIVSPRYYLN